MRSASTSAKQSGGRRARFHLACPLPKTSGRWWMPVRERRRRDSMAVVRAAVESFEVLAWAV
jgi:hypothetical protein